MPPDDDLTRRYGPPKSPAEIRHWSTYATVGEWFADYHGHVPIQIPAAISRLIRDTGMSFPDAYRTLLHKGAIIHLDKADDFEPPA